MRSARVAGWTAAALTWAFSAVASGQTAGFQAAPEPTPEAGRAASDAPPPPQPGTTAAPPAPTPAPVLPSAYLAPQTYPDWPHETEPALAPGPHSRRHDGFYLRMGLGVGYAYSGTDGALQGVHFDAMARGAGEAFELLIGGTIPRGVVLGGGLVLQTAESPRLSLKMSGTCQCDTFQSTMVSDLRSELEYPGRTTLGVIGPFIDWFPNDTGGGHVGAIVGIGDAGMANGRNGYGGALFGGYDFWISREWSLGIEGRAMVMTGSHTEQSFDSNQNWWYETWNDSGTAFTIAATALYH